MKEHEHAAPALAGGRDRFDIAQSSGGWHGHIVNGSTGRVEPGNGAHGRGIVGRMLTAAALGMFLYGFYSAAWAVVDLVRGARLELWAELGLVLFGALLALAAAFVRVRLPGGLLFAVGAMLALQALTVHDAVHLGTAVEGQIAAGVAALVLAALAYIGTRQAERS
jgi:hypothetical protein